MKQSGFLQITPGQVTPALRSLFDPSFPASLRGFAVLDGQAAGRIFTDDPGHPGWGLVQEAAFGSLYLAGEIPPAMLHSLMSQLRNEGDVLVGIWQDDPRWSLLPPPADYSGYTLDFTQRVSGQPVPAVPVRCELRRLDRSLFKQILGRNMLIRLYGSIELALQWGFGLCLLRDGEILCETFAGPSADGIIEIGVETHPHHMQQGFATLTCQHLIHQVEQQGYRTYWNCAKANLASTALAHKLGFFNEKEYHLQAWFHREA
jgi:hypothetical protein